MRRILAGLAVAGLMVTMAAPAYASADAETARIQVHGAEAWITDRGPDSPPGRYYEAYVQAFVADDTRDGKSLDWIYIGYGVCRWLRNGNVACEPGAGGYALDGAAGLEMSVSDLGEATVRASIPVGYCREYASEDEGGNCIDYVDVGVVELDLEWTATSGLMTWNSQELYHSPASWLNRGSGVHHYREALLTGHVTIPGLGTRGIVTSVDGWDGYLTRWHGQSLDLSVIPGPPS